MSEDSDTISAEEFLLEKEILLNDWNFTKNSIRDLDGSSFKIKGWAITVFTASLGAAVALKVPAVALVTILASLLFWLMDGLYKSFQQRFILRDHEICRYFGSESLLADQKAKKISISVAIAFDDLPRLSEVEPIETYWFVKRLSGLIGLDRKNVLDVLIAMSLQNIAALYISLITLSFVSWIVFSIYLAVR